MKFSFAAKNPRQAGSPSRRPVKLRQAPGEVVEDASTWRGGAQRKGLAANTARFRGASRV